MRGIVIRCRLYSWRQVEDEDLEGEVGSSDSTTAFERTASRGIGLELSAEDVEAIQGMEEADGAQRPTARHAALHWCMVPTSSPSWLDSALSPAPPMG